jgi:hypothetical protein
MLVGIALVELAGLTIPERAQLAGTVIARPRRSRRRLQQA